MLEAEFFQTLQALLQQIPSKYRERVLSFIDGYRRAVLSFDQCMPALLLYAQLLQKEIQTPFVFEPYHKKIRYPQDYYKFSLDFIRPIVDLPHSTIRGKEYLDTITDILERKENVILLANHQTEADPQAISILLEKTHPQLGEKIIYIAGERVIVDPVAVPFSIGCDLLCIYSKRYIDHPPEQKQEKQFHNKKTMQLMSELLQEGGKIIYVAPSGGRDRKNKDGIIEIAPFDPNSIEMLYLMARKAETPTHFIPLTLATYHLFPPPATIQKEIGEERFAQRSPIHLGLHPPFDMDHFAGANKKDKHLHREARAKAIWEVVLNTYQIFNSLGSV